MRIRPLLLTTIFLTPTISFAFFCPTNFNQIDFGNTLEQVKAACGKPDKEETKEADEKVPQEWTYYIPQTVASDSMTQEQGTLKTTISFDANGSAINISVNGVGVGSSNICGAAPIQLGSTLEMVKAACGEPGFINKQPPPAASSQPKQKTTNTTFTYNSNPPAKLIFTNNLLTSKE